MLADDVESGQITAYEFHMAVAQVTATTLDDGLSFAAGSVALAPDDLLSPDGLILALRALADDMERSAGVV
jgi:hypothetical protein